MNDRKLLTIIVLALIALAAVLTAVAVYTLIVEDLGPGVKAVLALVSTIVIGIVGIGRVLAGKSRR